MCYLLLQVRSVRHSKTIHTWLSLEHKLSYPTVVMSSVTSVPPGTPTWRARTTPFTRVSSSCWRTTSRISDTNSPTVQRSVMGSKVRVGSQLRVKGQGGVTTKGQRSGWGHN